MLFLKMICDKDTIIYSDLILKELTFDFDKKDLYTLFCILDSLGALKKVVISGSQYDEAKSVALRRCLPHPDVLHAIVARDDGAVLVSQDAHFQRLRDLVVVRKPQEIV
jgi:predicted nucleic acid-binding protein